MTNAIKCVKTAPLPFDFGGSRLGETFTASEHATFRVGQDMGISCLLIVDHSLGAQVEWQIKLVKTGEPVDVCWQDVGTHYGNDRWSGQHVFVKRAG